MSQQNESEVTALLKAWGGGDAAALQRLTPLVYEELKRIARNSFRGERSNHILQPTAVVHEAFASLVDVEVDWQNRAHFFALSARMMRRILINHAKAHNAAKRGGGVTAVTLKEDLAAAAQAPVDIIDLDVAIGRLAELDSRKAELIDLHVFTGLSFAEMAEVTGLSRATLDRELRFAKAWLKEALNPSSE